MRNREDVLRKHLRLDPSYRFPRGIDFDALAVELVQVNAEWHKVIDEAWRARAYGRNAEEPPQPEG